MNKINNMDIKRFIGKVKLLIIFALIIFAIRLTYINHIGSLDESSYLAVSSIIGPENPLYTSVYASKMPLFYIINSIVIDILPIRSVYFMRVYISFLAAITSLILYEITKTLNGKLSGVLAGISFAIFSSIPVYEGFFVLTEPYMIFFESLTLLLILKWIIEPRKAYMVSIGFLLGCSFLIRQTSALYIGLILTFILTLSIYKKKPFTNTSKNIKVNAIQLSLGTIFIFLFIIIYLKLGNTQIQDIIYSTLIEPFSYVKSTRKARTGLRFKWFMDISLVSLPLIILGSVSFIFKPQSNKINLNDFLIVKIFMAIWIILVCGFYLSPYFTGFHHEYLEIVPALSILTGIGFDSIYQKIKRVKKLNHRYFAYFCLILLILLSSHYGVYNTIDKIDKYNNTEDLIYAREISNIISIESSGKLYVLEMNWPKIGPSIYYLSDKYPIGLGEMFQFPNRIDSNRSLKIINWLETSDIKSVVIIGSNSPFKETQMIYNYTKNNYELVYNSHGYAPYPELQNESIRIFKKH